jgi:hypothetical protein
MTAATGTAGTVTAGDDANRSSYSLEDQETTTPGGGGEEREGLEKEASALPPQRRAVVSHLRQRTGLDDLEARDAEIGVYNASLQWADRHDVARSWSCRLFFDAYLAHANSVIDNLDPTTPAVGNSGLLARVRGGEFAPHDVAFLAPHEAFPERWREVLEAKVQRDEYTYNRKPEAMTDQYKCKRCHKRECVYYEQQTRSCDEPMSLFITCISCGNRWRMG